MKKIPLLTLILLISCAAYSQADFRQGYIITNARDTLTGLVDYREGSKAFIICHFKTSDDQVAVTYAPGEIIGYGFTGDRFFQSREITNRELGSRMVFLEVLVRGAITLYKFEGFYYVEKDDILHQLENERIEEEVNDTIVKRKMNQHMSVFNMLMFDCVAIRPKLQNVISLSERPVTMLVEEYNRCMGGYTVSFKEHKPWLKLGIGVAGGVEFSMIAFDSDYEPIKHLKGNFELSKLALAGMSVEFKVPRLTERVSFLVDLYYVDATYRLHKVFTIQPYTFKDQVTIKINELKIPFGVRYAFSERKITPFAGLGLTSVLHLSSGSRWVHEAEADGYFESSEEEALEMNKSQLGFWGGVGAAVSVSKRLNAFLELRYENTDGVAGKSLMSISTTRSSIANVDVIVGVRLK